MLTKEKIYTEFEIEKEIEEIQPKIYSFILSTVHNRSDAKDILQETNYVIVSKKNDFDPSKGKLISWAIRIAKYQVMAFLTRRKRNRLHFSSEMIEDLADQYQNENTEEYLLTKSALKICFDLLPEHMRSIAELRFKKEKTLKEISKESGRSVGAISATLFRIRENLIKCTRKKVNQYKVYGEFKNE